MLKCQRPGSQNRRLLQEAAPIHLIHKSYRKRPRWSRRAREGSTLPLRFGKGYTSSTNGFL
jgi:hypothetical protein